LHSNFFYVITTLQQIQNHRFWLLPERFNVYSLEIAQQFLLCYNNLKTAAELKFWLLQKRFIFNIKKIAKPFF